jgi:protein ImuB
VPCGAEAARGGGAAASSGGVRRARRLAALWLPDWPVVAAISAGAAPADAPVMVADGRRVTAVRAAARAAGARRGMRRRTAASLCPDGIMAPADPARDARAFEEVAVLAQTLAPGVELLRPGLLLCPALGASRYHGGDEALAEHLLTQVAAETGAEAWVGIADGLLAAILAARDGVVVAAGTSPDYLAPRPLTDLGVALRGTAHGEDLDVLTDLLTRLGVKTLGDLARLPAPSVTERFGSVGVWARRLALAEDVLTAPGQRLPREFAAFLEADPPLGRVEQAAQAAGALAQDLHAQLTACGQTYDRLKVAAATEAGQQLERTWRLEGVDSAGVVERVRWQLEGWLAGRSGLAPTGALTRLALEAQEVHPAGAGSSRLWGTSGHAAARAARGAERINTMLGGHGVYQPVVQGGREPRERVRLVEWGDETVPARPLDRPWPGQVPSPAPSLAPAAPPEVDLADAQGRAIQVSPELELSARPAFLDQARVTGWAGPWPVFGRWWAPGSSGRVYLQVQAEGERTALLACEAGRWRLEGVYS